MTSSIRSVKRESTDISHDDDTLEQSCDARKTSSSEVVVKKFYPCDMCPAHFGMESDLDRHIEDAHKGGMYVCDHCGMVKWTRETITQHLQDVHPDKPPTFEMRRKVYP